MILTEAEMWSFVAFWTTLNKSFPPWFVCFHCRSTGSEIGDCCHRQSVQWLYDGILLTIDMQSALVYMVRIRDSHSCGPGSIPGCGTFSIYPLRQFLSGRRLVGTVRPIQIRRKEQQLLFEVVLWINLTDSELQRSWSKSGLFRRPLKKLSNSLPAKPVMLL